MHPCLSETNDLGVAVGTYLRLLFGLRGVVMRILF